jgi:hypothetical protein
VAGGYVRLTAKTVVLISVKSWSVAVVLLVVTTRVCPRDEQFESRGASDELEVFALVSRPQLSHEIGRHEAQESRRKGPAII